MNLSSQRTAMLAAACSLAVSTLASAQSAPTPVTPRPPMSAQPDASPRSGTRTVTATVRSWLINPNGDIDGMLLDDGTQVNVPPHLSASMGQTFKLKDRVEVTGSAAAGSTFVQAALVKNVSSGRSVVDQPPREGMAPPVPREPGSLTAMSTSGRVTRLLFGPMGEVNGAVVDNGAIVRFPPRAEALDSQPALKVGGQLFAMGYGTRNDYGSALEATRIGATAESAQAVFTAPRVGPRPMPPTPDRAGPRPVPPKAPPAAPDGAVPPAPVTTPR